MAGGRVLLALLLLVASCVTHCNGGAPGNDGLSNLEQLDHLRRLDQLGAGGHHQQQATQPPLAGMMVELEGLAAPSGLPPAGGTTASARAEHKGRTVAFQREQERTREEFEAKSRQQREVIESLKQGHKQAARSAGTLTAAKLLEHEREHELRQKEAEERRSHASPGQACATTGQLVELKNEVAALRAAIRGLRVELALGNDIRGEAGTCGGGEGREEEQRATELVIPLHIGGSSSGLARVVDLRITVASASADRSVSRRLRKALQAALDSTNATMPHITPSEFDRIYDQLLEMYWQQTLADRLAD